MPFFNDVDDAYDYAKELAKRTKEPFAVVERPKDGRFRIRPRTRVRPWELRYCLGVVMPNLVIIERK
jgi:hypothetical protein